jgi:hypothetical protein
VGGIVRPKQPKTKRFYPPAVGEITMKYLYIGDIFLKKAILGELFRGKMA